MFRALALLTLLAACGDNAVEEAEPDAGCDIPTPTTRTEACLEIASYVCDKVVDECDFDIAETAREDCLYFPYTACIEDDERDPTRDWEACVAELEAFTCEDVTSDDQVWMDLCDL
jgi:hypothetical protein